MRFGVFFAWFGRMTITCIGSVVFFFKQKTAYEVRISDWSSDVCSSDLVIFTIRAPDTTPLTVALIRSDWMVEPAARELLSTLRPWICSARLRIAASCEARIASSRRSSSWVAGWDEIGAYPTPVRTLGAGSTVRSDAGRVGKEGVRTGRNG